MEDWNVKFKGEKVFIYNFRKKIFHALSKSDFYNSYLNLPKDELEKSIERLSSNINRSELLFEENSENFVYPTIITNYSCNFQCEYCFQNSSKSCKTRTPDDICNKIELFYEELGIFDNKVYTIGGFAIMGGETLLPENSELIKSVYKRWGHLNNVLYTNATYLNEYLEMLKKYKKNILLKISLDGLKDMHANCRKHNDPNIYDKIINNIKNAQNEGYNIEIVTVYNRRYSKEYLEFFDFLQANFNWIKSDRFNVSIIPNRQAGANDVIYEDLSSYMELLDMDYRFYYVNSLAFIPKSSNIVNKLSDEFYVSSDIRCNNIKSSSFSFLPNGRILICHINDSSQLAIGEIAPKIVINKEFLRYVRHLELDEKCKTCPNYGVCNGGCLVGSIVKAGDIECAYCGIWEDYNSIMIRAMEKVLDKYFI